MKLYLINPDYMAFGDPPLGLAYLAAYVRKILPETKIKILDQIKEQDILKILKKEKPQIIGISSVSSNFYRVKRFAEKLKKASKNSLLVLGGVHITTFPDSFKNSIFDMAIRGEGEIPMTKLISSLKSGLKISELKKIPGLIFRDNDKIINTGLSEQIQNLDEIPFPARDLLNMRYYLLPRFSSDAGIDPIGSILTSRGCPFACKFCSSSAFWGRKVRFFSAKRVVEEIEFLYNKYHYKHIYIYDDLFSINKERLKEIIRRLKEKNLIGKIKFSVYGRANCFDEETASLLKKMNIHEIAFGFETGSQKMLDYLKGQGIKIEDSVRAIKIAKKYNLVPSGFFMLGSPTETVGDVKKTYEFIKKYCKNNFSIYQTIPLPGTEVWNYAIDNKIITKDFYENKQKQLLDIDPKLLLSKDLSKKDFSLWFNKIQNLNSEKKSNFYKKLLMIRLRHIKAMLSKEFIKKAYNLKNSLFI